MQVDRNVFLPFALAMLTSVVLTAGCGSTTTPTTPAAAVRGTAAEPTIPSPADGEESGPAPSATAERPDLATADTSWGKVLVDGEGNALYAFTQDEPGQSSCTGSCAEAWPPATVEGDASGGSGVNTASMGTVERADGSRQLTYAGRPLYRFHADTAPGSTKGQAVNGSWFLVDQEGELVREIETDPAGGGYNY